MLALWRGAVVDENGIMQPDERTSQVEVQPNAARVEVTADGARTVIPALTWAQDAPALAASLAQTGALAEMQNYFATTWGESEMSPQVIAPMDTEAEAKPAMVNEWEANVVPESSLTTEPGSLSLIFEFMDKSEDTGPAAGEEESYGD